MKISVISYIPGKVDLTGTYNRDKQECIEEFLHTLGVAWDHEALVMVNHSIVDGSYRLRDGDEIHLLIPILGG